MMAWLLEKLGLRCGSIDRAQRAIDLANDVTLHSRSLREQIEPYRMHDDPLAAIQHSTRLGKDILSSSLNGHFHDKH